MILCCGEALVDMIPSPTVAGPDGFVPLAGGAVFNTAIALGRLGVRTGMLTGLSNDMFGQQLSEALKASNVDTFHVATSDRPTTLAFVRLQDGHATYSFFDENSAGSSPEKIGESIPYGAMRTFSEPPWIRSGESITPRSNDRKSGATKIESQQLGNRVNV